MSIRSKVTTTFPPAEVSESDEEIARDIADYFSGYMVGVNDLQMTREQKAVAKIVGLYESNATAFEAVDYLRDYVAERIEEALARHRQHTTVSSDAVELENTLKRVIKAAYSAIDHVGLANYECRQREAQEMIRAALSPETVCGGE